MAGIDIAPNTLDFAIQRGLKRVEAGTRGPHKLQRGYVPHRTFSAHWIENDSFRSAVARFLEEERELEAREAEALKDYAPFRKS